ncbi:MAG: choice-of-anchor Q domain-containing protein, partial [Candidatus Taylorbacteria bacterium]
ILHDSQAEVSGQMSGMLLGGGSSCNCSSNLIKDGKGDGIDELGLGGNYIYNNLIINPGQSYTGSGMKHGIFIGTQTPASGRGYHLVFNTIVSPRTNGIDFRSVPAAGSEASDNIITGPGGSYIKSAPGTSLNQVSNLLLASAGEVKFVNPSTDNYDLLPSSPAVNTGSAITGFSLNADFLGRWRPWPWKYDIGAFECHDSSLLSVGEHKASPAMRVNSCYYKNGKLNISVSLAIKNTLKVELYTLAGSQVSSFFKDFDSPGTFDIENFVGRLQDACYICILRFADDSFVRKMNVESF